MKRHSSIALAALIALGVTTPAQATTMSWPSGGEFDMGVVSWTVTGDGIVAGTDDAGVYGSPLALLHSLYINNGEVFDCTHGDVATDTVVTQESNGDVTITCDSYEFDQGYGLTGQLEIRIFAPIDGHYWVRSWYHYDADRTYIYDFADKGPLRTANSDTSVSDTGGTTAISRIWFDPNAETASDFTETEDNGRIFQIAGESLADGAADYLFFDVVVVPVSSTAQAGTDAAESAAALTENFQLTERFQLGLDPLVHYSGWELTPDASGTSDALAETGFSGDELLLFASISVSLGILAVVRRRVRRN